MRTFLGHSRRRRLGLAAVTIGVLGALMPTGVALAATPLPTPDTPVVSSVTTSSVTFTWSAPAGPVTNYTIQVIDGPLVPWHTLATTAATTYTHSNLTPDTVYEYRVIANPTSGSGYTASSPSGIRYTRTAPLPDSIPPTTPGTPIAYQVSTIAAAINFAASIDNNRVAGYWVQHQVGGVWTDWATNNVNTVYLRDLTPNTSHTVAVVAFDANGNRSARSAPLTFTTRAIEPSPTCRAQLVTFYHGYLLTVTVENMTQSTVVSNWTVTFTLPAAHLGTVFNSTITRSGDQATLTPAVWYATISPGGTATVGGSFSYSSESPLPSGFALHFGSTTMNCAA